MFMFIFLFLLALCSPQIFSAAAYDSEAKEDLAAPAPMSKPEFIAALSADMDSKSKLHVTIALNQVKPERYNADFVEAVNALSAGMSTFEKCHVITILNLVKPEHYQAFIGIVNTLSAGLIPEGKVRIVQRARLNPSSLNAARALLFTRWMERGEESLQRTIQVLETRRDSPVPPLQAEFAPGVNPYEVGMNVHAAGRDQKTQEAFKLLLSLWAPTDSEVAQYSQAFIDYAINQDAADAAVANRVLLGIGRKTHDFGGLLQAKGLLIQGEMILPRDLLARLWHFVTIKIAKDISPAEVKTAQASIIGALRDSVETDDHVVCDPGKLQRLARILQGRLEGAKIDQRLEISADAKLVKVNPALLQQPAEVQPMAAAAPVPARPQYIRDVNVIQNHMNELDRKWQAITPATAEEMLRDTFEYLGELKRQDIYLDPRDVVFYLIFGTCKTHNGPGGKFRLDPNFGPLADTQGMFRLDDYMMQYSQREQENFVAAQAQQQPAAAAAALMPHQDQAAAGGAGAMRVQRGQQAAIIAEQDREYEEALKIDLANVEAARAAAQPAPEPQQLEALAGDAAAAAAAAAAGGIDVPQPQQLSADELRQARIAKFVPPKAAQGG